MINAMTIDVEDYYQVSAFERVISRKSWTTFESRVENSTKRLLDLFDNHQIKATFFTLGMIADEYPDLIQDIANRGHELASHGWSHLRVTNQTPVEFFEDIVKTKHVLEQTAGVPVHGYRAPSFSINAQNAAWAFEKIALAGYRYSSSVNPIQHDHYGIPDAPRFAYKPLSDNPDFIECPVSTTEFFGKRLPMGGGGFFRLFPLWFFSWGTKRIHAQDNAPTMLYLHPWEIDPDQPVIKGTGLKTRFRHRVGLSRMYDKLDQFMCRFDWGRMIDAFPELHHLRDENSPSGGYETRSLAPEQDNDSIPESFRKRFVAKVSGTPLQPNHLSKKPLQDPVVQGGDVEGAKSFS